MELIEHWEASLAGIVTVGRLILETISVLCVLTGLLKTLQLVIHLRRHQRHNDDFPFNQVRIQFGTWLALALEFQLGADILSTTVAPTLQDLGRLAIVAVVRTFLNYFLGKELEAELEMEHRRQEHDLRMAQEYGKA